MVELLLALLGNAPLMGALLGLVTPLLTAVFQQPRYSYRQRVLVGVGISIVVGLLTAGATGVFASGAVTVATIMAVVAAAEAAYRGLWQRTGTAETIERATPDVLQSWVDHYAAQDSFDIDDLDEDEPQNGGH